MTKDLVDLRMTLKENEPHELSGGGIKGFISARPCALYEVALVGYLRAAAIAYHGAYGLGIKDQPEGPMEYQAIKLEKTGHKAVITLNRPHVLNAINLTMEKELIAAYEDLKVDRSIRVLIITAAGDRGFCPGADIRAGTEGGARDHLERSPIKRVGLQPIRRVGPKDNGLFKPTIVAVNAICAAAGFYFVTHADIVIASERAEFIEPHTSNGSPPLPECLLLLRKGMPYTWVMRMALLGRSQRLSADKAMQLGLVTEVVPHDKLMLRAHELADQVAENAPLACQATVKLMWESMDLGLDAALKQMWYVAEMYDQYGGETAIGGPAFREGRKPDWDLALERPSEQSMLGALYDKPPSPQPPPTSGDAGEEGKGGI